MRAGNVGSVFMPSFGEVGGGLLGLHVGVGADIAAALSPSTAEIAGADNRRGQRSENGCAACTSVS